MKLSHLSDHSLLTATLRLAREERALLTMVLWHLREIEARRLFSSLGYSSLFAYAQGELGYSEDQAQRRIAAMRLLRELPGIEKKISSGALTLTNLGKATAVFRREKLAPERRVEVLAKLEGVSSRQAEKILAEISPVPERPDRAKRLNEGKVELRLTADEALLEKIEQLKGLLAHKHPSLSLGELFEKLCDLGLEAWDKGREPAAARGADSQAAIRRELHRKGRCEGCGSRHALEIDHRRPRALGGGNERANLRLLCRSCNQRAAITALGRARMAPFLERGRPRPAPS